MGVQIGRTASGPPMTIRQQAGLFYYAVLKSSFLTNKNFQRTGMFLLNSVDIWHLRMELCASVSFFLGAQ